MDGQDANKKYYKVVTETLRSSPLCTTESVSWGNNEIICLLVGKMESLEINCGAKCAYKGGTFVGLAHWTL